MTGLWIPQEIMQNTELTLTEKCILSQIIAYSETENGVCFASNAHFAEAFGCTAGTVSRSIAKLEKLGFIVCQIDRMSGNKRTIEPVTKNDKPQIIKVIEPTPPTQTLEKPIPQKVKKVKEIKEKTPKKVYETVFDDSFSDESISLFHRFLQMRIEIKKPLNSQTSINMQIEKLAKVKDDVRIKTMIESIANRWQGLFPEKYVNDGKPSNLPQQRIDKSRSPVGVQPTTGRAFGNINELLDG